MFVLPYAVLHPIYKIYGMRINRVPILCIHMTSGPSCTRNRGHRRRRNRSRNRSRSRTRSRNISRIRSMTRRACVSIIVINKFGVSTRGRPTTNHRIDRRAIIRVGIMTGAVSRVLDGATVFVFNRSNIMGMPIRIRDRARVLNCQLYSYD